MTIARQLCRTAAVLATLGFPLAIIAAQPDGSARTDGGRFVICDHSQGRAEWNAMFQRDAHSSMTARPVGSPTRSVGPAAPPGYERAPAPFDEPDEAARWYLRKRSPDGVSPIPTEKYFQALERMKDMQQYSSASNRALSSRRAMARSGQPLAALGTWSWLGPGNIGGRTRALVIDPTTPNTMYAGGVAGGVWKTTNAGASWAPLSDFLANLAVNSMAMDPSNPNVLYAGTGEGFENVDGVRGAGIFKTTDRGATWTQLAATNNSNFYYVNRLVVSASSPQHVYAATSTGIWRSVDGGASWVQSFASSLRGGCLDLQIRTDQPGDYLFAGEGNFVQGNILRNTDAGGSGTWSVVFTEAGMGRTSIAIAPSNPSIVYALAAETASGNYLNGLHAVYRSTSSGDPGSWTSQVTNQSGTYLNTLLLTNPLEASLVACGLTGPNKFMNQGWYDNIIKVDPVNPDRVWVGGIDLFRSDDAGANWGLASFWWAPLGNSGRVHADNHVMVFHPSYNGGSNQTMFVGNDGGIFRTDNAVTGALATGIAATCNTGNSSLVWTSLNNNYGVTQFYYGLPYPDGATYFGGAQDNGTNRGSDAAGPNAWASIIGGDGGYVAVDPGNTNILYGETTNLSLEKSTDGGAHFASATNGIAEPSSEFGFINPFVMDPANSQTLWTGGRMPWRTTDAGATWTQAGSAFTTGNFPASAIAVAPTDSNYVLFGRSSGFISRTTTALANTSSTAWPAVLPTPAQAYISWLTFDPVNKNVAYATYSTFGVPHVWKSTDAGATWASIDGSGATGIPDIPVHSIVVNPGDTSRLYVGTDLGVFTSTDGGGTWLVENTGFANVVTESLALNGTRLFAFTHGRGAYRVGLTPSSTSLTASFTFSANPKAGQPVQFTDTSTGSPNSWSWNFGDGGTSTSQNPSHTYAVAGPYQVSLTVSNAGGSNTATQTVNVGLSSPIVCTADAFTMCMVSGRYQVTSHWKNQYNGGATANLSKAALTDATGAFWKYDSATYEYLIRFNPGNNGRIWIAIPTFTDVEFWIDVTDTKSGQFKEYHSAPGNQTLIYDPYYFVFP